jgi:hypothetical protein
MRWLGAVLTEEFIVLTKELSEQALAVVHEVPHDDHVLRLIIVKRCNAGIGQAK